MRKVIKFSDSLKRPCKKVSVEEGEKIAAELFQILVERGDGIGLAANQVGIDASVAVVNVREPIVLINPRIVEKSDEVMYREGCLSFPKNPCNTKRYKNIVVECDNHEGKLSFGTNNEENDTEHYLLESVCVQHEIDHLDGIRILDRKVIKDPIRSNKVGRNERVTITDGNEIKTLKWKKAQSLVESGIWEIKNEISNRVDNVN